jgi:hypothetical protein
VEIVQFSKTIRTWKDLELKVLDLLTSLGYEAERNAKIKGARGKHQVDVAARFEFGGFRYLIIVECKYWNKKVDKNRVATLSNIVSDIGANKGIIISIKGFQKGAFELARNSNIELRSFNQFAKQAEETLEEALRQRCQNLISSLSRVRSSFSKFHGKMSDKAEEIDSFWYPTAEGFTFLGGLSIFKDKLEDLDTKEFPCYHMEVPFHDCEDKDLERIEVNNKVEYLKQLVLNIEKWKKEAELHYDKIFSEY